MKTFASATSLKFKLHKSAIFYGFSCIMCVKNLWNDLFPKKYEKKGAITGFCHESDCDRMKHYDLLFETWRTPTGMAYY